MEVILYNECSQNVLRQSSWPAERTLAIMSAQPPTGGAAKVCGRCLRIKSGLISFQVC